MICQEGGVARCKSQHVVGGEGSHGRLIVMVVVVAAGVLAGGVPGVGDADGGGFYTWLYFPRN